MTINAQAFASVFQFKITQMKVSEHGNTRGGFTTVNLDIECDTVNVFWEKVFQYVQLHLKKEIEIYYEDNGQRLFRYRTGNNPDVNEIQNYVVLFTENGKDSSGKQKHRRLNEVTTTYLQKFTNEYRLSIQDSEKEYVSPRLLVLQYGKKIENGVDHLGLCKFLDALQPLDRSGAVAPSAAEVIRQRLKEKARETGRYTGIIDMVWLSWANYITSFRNLEERETLINQFVPPAHICLLADLQLQMKDLLGFKTMEMIRSSNMIKGISLALPTNETSRSSLLSERVEDQVDRQHMP
ncbi:hypothetical protein HDV06_002079 [Boothiomyces sp. JEL0866]|nr:hypothetical protein HDV06_002079 [Boothiomyces sp. JEL0866]